MSINAKCMDCKFKRTYTHPNVVQPICPKCFGLMIPDAELTPQITEVTHHEHD